MFQGVNPMHITYKIRRRICNLWNLIDILMYLTFVLSVVLRFTLHDADFRWARAFYSVTLVLFYLRLLHLFFAVESIGPKIIMIQLMVSINRTSGKKQVLGMKGCS